MANTENAPARRKPGRPVKGTQVDWEHWESIYVTTMITLREIAVQANVSPACAGTQSRKRRWVIKRKRHQIKTKEQTEKQLARRKGKSLADEIEIVSQLAYGTAAKLAAIIRSEPFKMVKCECGREHRVAMPDHRMTTTDLATLIKLRSHLKGDPEFRAKIDADVQVNLAQMTSAEIVAEFEKAYKESEAIVL